MKAPHSNDLVFYTGGYQIEAHYKTLLENMNMNHATDVVVSGSSAGGLAVYFHIDMIADIIRKGAVTKPRVVGVPDAGIYNSPYPNVISPTDSYVPYEFYNNLGFFMDLPSYNGKMAYAHKFNQIFTNQNATKLNAGGVPNFLIQRMNLIVFL